jgi:hypothetical protein
MKKYVAHYPLRLAQQAALSIRRRGRSYSGEKMRRRVLMVGIIGSDIIVTLWLAALFIERTGGVRPF